VPVERGVIVATVQRGTGAAAAGLRGSLVSESVFGGGVIERIGDVIVAIDNKEINAPQDIGEALKNRKPGDVVQVVVLRQGRRVTVPIQLSDRPLSAT
jgi:S1-C subfamily serine protease